jgi:mercuric ion transport protein
VSATLTTRDWARDRRVSWLWPAAFTVAGIGSLGVPDPWGAVVAAAGFIVAGALCVGNTLRCQRAHCAITGPLYLAAASLFLARAGGASVSSSSIVMVAVIGTGLAFVPEWLGIRYLGTPSVSSMATAGALLAASFATACCLGPTLFVLFGVAVAGLRPLGALEPYRPLFLLAGFACWTLAYRRHRRALCAGGACGTAGSRQTRRVLLWSSLVFLVIAAGFPHVIASLGG